MKIIALILLLIYLTVVIYSIIQMIEAGKEEICPKCGVEMKHWDDRSVICPICKKGKKLW